MSKEENKLIRAEFRRMLDKLIDSKIRPTATEIISVEQPLICLFEEVMYKLEKQQKETEEKNCLIDVLQHRIEELLDNKKEINYIKPIDIPVHNYISEDKIREKINQLKEIADEDNPEIYIKIDAYEELLEE